MIEPVIGQSEEVRSHDQPITPPVSEIVATIVRSISIEIQCGEGFTKAELEELRTQSSLSSIISSLYPELTAEKIEEVESGIYDALPKEPKAAPLIKVLDSIASDPGTESRVLASARTQSRNPKKGDRVKNFAGRLGTVLKVNPRGLARYEINWDGGKTEHYSQKEFNRSLFELVTDSVKDTPSTLATQQIQRQLPLENRPVD